jgi:hypothetical protein
VETIRKATERETQAIRRVELCEKYLALCHHSLRDVLHHEDFVALLRSEGLQLIPEAVMTFLGQDAPQSVALLSAAMPAKEAHDESPNLPYA